MMTNMRKCGYCGTEMDESDLIKEEIHFVDHDCDFVEETCPYCGWHSEIIEDQLESWAY